MKNLSPLLQNITTFNKKLHILILLPTSNPLPPTNYGGIERIAYTLITYLLKNGHKVTILGHKDSIGNFNVIPRTKNYHGIYYKKEGFQSLLEIREIIKKVNPDIVHDFSVPTIATFCPSHIPLVWSLPSPSVHRFYIPLLWRQSNTIVVGNAHHITKSIPSFIQRRTIYNSVEYDKYTFIDSATSDAPLVFLGRINETKGAHLAIQIALKTNEKLIIAGNIPSNAQDYFNSQIKPYLSDQIQYIGTVNDVEKNKLFGNAKAFLFPLQVHEAFGITVVESMSCGTPVIAFPYGAMPELITDGDTGYLCQSLEDMIVKIGQISSLNRQKCRENVEKLFSTETMCKAYLNTYYELLSEKTPLREI